MEVVDLFVGQEFKESDVCFEMCKKKTWDMCDVT